MRCQRSSSPVASRPNLLRSLPMKSRPSLPHRRPSRWWRILLPNFLPCLSRPPVGICRRYPPMRLCHPVRLMQLKNLERKKAFSVGYSGRRKKKLRPKLLRVRPCRIPRPKDLSRSCHRCPHLPQRLPEKIYRPCHRSPPKSRICRPSRMHRTWPRKWSVKISSANWNELPTIAPSAYLSPNRICHPYRHQAQPRKKQPVFPLCPSLVVAPRHCLSCPNPAEPNPTYRHCPSPAVRPQCLLYRSRMANWIFLLYLNQKPVVRGICHPCHRFRQVNNWH